MEKKENKKIKNNDIELKLILSKTWSEWLLASTAHGLPNLSNSSRLIRLMWAVCFFLATIYSFYSIVSLIVAYFTYDVDIHIQVVVNAPVDFPAVFIDSKKTKNSLFFIPYLNIFLLKKGNHL